MLFRWRQKAFYRRVSDTWPPPGSQKREPVLEHVRDVWTLRYTRRIAPPRNGRSPSAFIALIRHSLIRHSYVESEVFMSTELPKRPTCPVCGSTRVGTLAKQITKDTAWRCADCGETFKAKPPQWAPL